MHTPTSPPTRPPTVTRRASLLGRAALVLIPVAFSAVAYYPIIGNFFFQDDFLNLYRIRNVNLWEYLWTPHGGHILLTRNTLFYLFAEIFGPAPSRFFWAVLLTHLLNVVLLFAAIRAWTGSMRLACLGATLFGTCPLNEGSLGWYSVYGHVVAATAYLPILVSAAHLESTGSQPSRRQLWTWYALTLVACTSFGVGIGLAMALPFVLLAILPRQRRPWLPPLVSLLVAVPVLYVASHLIYSMLSGERVNAGMMATLFFGNLAYSALTVFHLVAYGGTQLVLGFFRLSPDQYEPSISYVSAAVLAGGALLAWVRGSSIGRRRLIAACLIVASCYATIALGRSAFLAFLSQSVVQVASHPRYHYAGLVFLTLLICVILDNILARASRRRAVELVLLALTLAAIGGGYAWRRPAINHHDEARRSTESALAWIGKRIATTPPGKVTYFFNKPIQAGGVALIRQTVLPGWAAVFVIFYPDNTVDGKPIRFVQRGSDVVEAARHGIRSATLIISKDEFDRAREIESAPSSRPTD